MSEYAFEALDFVHGLVGALGGRFLYPGFVFFLMRVVHQLCQVVDPARDEVVRVESQKEHYHNNDSQAGQSGLEQELIEFFGDEFSQLGLLVGGDCAGARDRYHEVILLFVVAGVVAGHVEWRKNTSDVGLVRVVYLLEYVCSS